MPSKPGIWNVTLASQAVSPDDFINGSAPSGNAYYFSTSGSNTTGAGTQANPWHHFKGKKDGIAALAPGDVCYFNKGDVWTGSDAEIIVESSGLGSGATATNPIIFDAYGSGNLPTFCSAATSTGFTHNGGNIWQKTGQTQTYAYTVTQDDNKALGRWEGSITTIPAGAFRHTNNIVYVHLWSDADPNASSCRIGNFHGSSYYRGLIKTSETSTRGDYIHFKNLKVIGANRKCFTSSGTGNRFYYCEAMGSGAEGFESLKYVPSGEDANYTRFYNCTASYCNTQGTGNGQAFTTEAPYTWFIDCTAHHNFMAGFDFLDYGNDTNVTESGAIRCISYQNGLWNSGNSFDPGIYIDGASEIFLYGNVVWGMGTGSGGAGNARSGIAIGSELTKIAENVYVINNLVYGNHWLAFHTNNGPTIPNIKNITIVNNTFCAYTNGSFDPTLQFDDVSTVADNFIMRNNILVCNASNTAISYWMPSGSYLDADYNLYYRRGEASSATNIYSTNGGSTYYNLASWRTLSGEDTNSAYGDPLFVNEDVDADMDAHISPSSPAVNLGVANPFVVPSWLPADLFPYGGVVRGTTLASGVFDNTLSSIDAGYHYASGDVDPGAVPATTTRNLLLMGVG